MLPDIHPNMPLGHHVLSGEIKNPKGGSKVRFHMDSPTSAVAAECIARGVSVHDRHAVYEAMKREGHPSVIVS